MMRRILIEATREAWTRPKAWAAGLALLTGWCALAAWWLWLPLATALDVAVVAAVGLAALALPAWLVWRVRRRLREARLWALMLPPLAAGGGLAWLLVHWVPGVEGFAAQAVSAAVRFTLAAACITGAWLWIGRVGEKLIEESNAGTHTSIE